MAEVRIFTSRSCGWATRNYASLLEKGVDFDTVAAVDKHGLKKEEFLAATPFGMTPVLVHGTVRVFESLLINEYVNDEFPNPPLLPADPAGRIEARKWICFCELRLLNALTVIVRSVDSCTQQAAIEGFNADMNWFANHVLTADWRGPYFFGDLFSLLDIAFCTLFQTTRSTEEVLGRVFTGFQAPLETWRDNIAERPSIQQAIRIQERIPF